MCLRRRTRASASGTRWDCGQGVGLIVGRRSTGCSRTTTIGSCPQRLRADRHATREGRIRILTLRAIVVVDRALIDGVGTFGRDARPTSEGEGRGLSRRGSGQAKGGNGDPSSLILCGGRRYRTGERTCRTTGTARPAEDGVEGLGGEGTTTILGGAGCVLFVAGHGEDREGGGLAVSRECSSSSISPS